uniref:GTPase Era n=2 Tax=Anthurium amnicola TaxID=1678845 RepID=A0A1D1Z6I3_9ARAE
MKLLRNAQFEELSAEDLLLTYALNTDYLLTLPIYIDWKRASESNAVIFRRGYATEKQKGFLIIEKLDYLQSKLLQEMLFNISRPLKKLGIWITKALKNASETDELKILIEKLKAWMKGTFPQTPRSYVKGTFSDHLDGAHTEASELPIWLAAQRAAPRYEGFLSSIGPRGRLMRKLLSWIGFIPSMPEAAIELDTDSEVSEAYLRPNFLPRITLADIWKPASRDSCASNVWKMFKTGASILFSRSVLQEPAFQELILLYTDEVTQRESEKVEVMPLQLKIYKGIPYPDLPVIFPHKKLSFRILDTVRLDVASILGLLAYFVNYKFENILSSPSAIVLDVVAISALILYVTRVVLGYKQTWDRYQLLVNRTLYEKTLASGFGSVHFLLDASEQQQYKEAILAYSILLHAGRFQVSCRKSLGDACEKFIYDRFQEKVEMPIKNAIDTLLRLEIVREVPVNENFGLQALPCLKAYEVLRHRWDSLLS